MRKPIYGHFTHILHKEKWYIKSLCYNIVETLIFIQSLVKKKKSWKQKMYWWFKKKSIVFAYACSFMSFYNFFIFFKLSPNVLYKGHSITYEWNIIFNIYIYIYIKNYALNNVMTWKNTIFFLKNVPSSQEVKKCPNIYGIRVVITFQTSAMTYN